MTEGRKKLNQDGKSNHLKVKSETKNLKKNLPQISINEDNFYIASPVEPGADHFDGFWEIKADIQELFM